MLGRTMLRLAAVGGLVGALTMARPVVAESASPCWTLCMVLTAGSGHTGEEAIWYYTGCLLGCYGAGV